MNITDELEIPISWGGTNITLFLPVNYLTTEFNKDIRDYGAIIYNNYPLMPTNSKNFSNNVVSLKLYDELKNKIDVSNLTIPIKILIKKTKPDLKYCVFMDITNSTNMIWNSKNCTSQEFNGYILCTCNHLTDFALSNYNPLEISKDIAAIFNDAFIFKFNFTIFEQINYNNAIPVYFFGGALILWIIGLIITIRWDNNNEEDAFILEVDRIAHCCSKEEVIDNIHEIHEISTKEVENRRKHLILKFFLKKSNFIQEILLKIQQESEADSRSSIDSNGSFAENLDQDTSEIQEEDDIDDNDDDIEDEVDIEDDPEINRPNLTYKSTDENLSDRNKDSNEINSNTNTNNFSKRKSNKKSLKNTLTNRYSKAVNNSNRDFEEQINDADINNNNNVTSSTINNNPLNKVKTTIPKINFKKSILSTNNKRNKESKQDDKSVKFIMMLEFKSMRHKYEIKSLFNEFIAEGGEDDIQNIDTKIIKKQTKVEKLEKPNEVSIEMKGIETLNDSSELDVSKNNLKDAADVDIKGDVGETGNGNINYIDKIYIYLNLLNI